MNFWQGCPTKAYEGETFIWNPLYHHHHDHHYHHHHHPFNILTSGSCNKTLCSRSIATFSLPPSFCFLFSFFLNLSLSNPPVSSVRLALEYFSHSSTPSHMLGLVSSFLLLALASTYSPSSSVEPACLSRNLNIADIVNYLADFWLF